MQKWVYFNDAFVLEEEASLSLTDLSVQRGYGLFDYLKTIDGVPVFIDDHLDRFYFSAEQLHLAPPLNRMQLKEVVYEMIRKNGIADSGIKLILTGGDSADGYTPGKPNLIISQHPLQLPGAGAFQNGLKLISYEHQRQLPHVKTIDYLMAIWLQPLLKQKGADDVLYYYTNSVKECPRANFFILTKDDGLVTAADGILKGITRSKILQTAAKAGIVAEERTLSLEEVQGAKAAFICSTTKGILPVSQLDETLFDMDNALLKKLATILNTNVENHVNAAAEKV